MLSLVMPIVLSIIIAVSYGYLANFMSAPTPAQVQECNGLGINLDKCSDIEILKHTCIGGPGAPCGGSDSPPRINAIVAAIMIGCGVALIAGILSVRRIRNVRKATNR